MMNAEWRKTEKVILGMLVLLFAAGSSVLSYDNARASDLAPRFHWPDETTNAYFAGRVARGEPLAAGEPRNMQAGNFIHPRTANVRADGAIVPGGYLGLPLWYGIVGRLTSERVMLFLTPLLAAGGMLAFASLLTAFAGLRVALLATALLGIIPAMWLFTAAAFLPNVPFVSLLLIGVAMLASQRGDHHRTVHRPWWRWFLGGLSIGFALTIRTHELVWVAALLALVVMRMRPPRECLIAGALGLALPFLPILVLQEHLYGSPLRTGYARLDADGALPTEFVARGTPVLDWLYALIAPFGWHPLLALLRFWQYLIVPYWWLVGLAAIGMVMTWHPGSRGGRPIAVSMGLIAWLILSYGSWTIADPLVRASNVLTISYVRYWIPILVLLAGWAAVGAFSLLTHGPARVRTPLTMVLLFALVMVSVPMTVLHPTEGLREQRRTLEQHRQRARAVIAATDPSAIIISHRMDKAFFPERAVIHLDPANLCASSVRDRLANVSAGLFWYAPRPPAVPRISVADGSHGSRTPAVLLEPVDAVMPNGEQLFSVDAVHAATPDSPQGRYDGCGDSGPDEV